MGERLREAPRPSVRYSRSIPPERRGKISGLYRIDIKKKVMLVNTHGIIGKMPGIQRKEWLNGGVLLKTFDAWKLLPTEITERDSEQRRDILAFIAGEKRTPHGAKEYGELPSLESISIEIARLVLENIPEWNNLQPTVQFIIEPEIIRLINQDHKEFMDVEKAVKEFNAGINPMERLERHYDAGVPSNYDEMEREAKQKILGKIVQAIQELATAYASENENEVPDKDELGALASHTSSAVGKIIEDQKRTALRPPPEMGNTPTIPASPRGKRKSKRR